MRQGRKIGGNYFKVSNIKGMRCKRVIGRVSKGASMGGEDMERKKQ